MHAVWFVRFVILIELLLCIPGAGSAVAQEKVALVIGNAAYRSHAVLANPLNDARDIAAALSRLGFKVTSVSDAGFDSMRRTLRDFSRAAERTDIAVAYFAGHGIEIGGENYLIPVDAELRSDRDIEHEAVPLRSVMAGVSAARRLGLVVLDACRNDPFRSRMLRTSLTRTVTSGLARVEPAGSVLVAFAAREGTVADDGRERNSPFTKALLTYLEKPGLEVADLFREVRADVVEVTRRQQEPAIYGSLGRERVYLTGITPSATPSKVPCLAAGEHWRSAEAINTVAAFEDHLSRFRDCAFAGLARARIEALNKKLATPTPPMRETETIEFDIRTRITHFIEWEHLKDRENYAPRVDYFDKGVVSRESVLKDQADHARKWPVRNYSLIPGTLQIVMLGDDHYAVSFGFMFEKSNGLRRIEGSGRSQVRVKVEGGQFLVTGIKEIVDRR